MTFQTKQNVRLVFGIACIIPGIFLIATGLFGFLAGGFHPIFKVEHQGKTYYARSYEIIEIGVRFKDELGDIIVIADGNPIKITLVKNGKINE